MEKQQMNIQQNIMPQGLTLYSYTLLLYSFCYITLFSLSSFIIILVIHHHFHILMQYFFLSLFNHTIQTLQLLLLQHLNSNHFSLSDYSFLCIPLFYSGYSVLCISLLLSDYSVLCVSLLCSDFSV